MDLQYLNRLKSFDTHIIDTFLKIHAVATESEHLRINEQSKKLYLNDEFTELDKSIISQLLDGDHYFVDESKHLSFELAIVALYRKIEHTTKLAISCAFVDVNISKLFQIAEIDKSLRKKGITLENVKDYKAMDEIRCLNNSIKHGGFVNNELARYDGWNENEPLKLIDIAYARLAPLSKNYINSLIDEIIKAT